MKLPDCKKDGSMGSKAEMRDANEDKMSISEVMGKMTGYSMLGNHALSTKRSEMLKMKEIQEEEKEDSSARRIDIKGIGTYRKLLQVTARVLSLYKKPLSFKNATRDLQNQQVSEAELFWFREAQRSITDYDLKHRYQRLSPFRRSDGIIVVGRRTEKWMNISYNNEMLILLPYSHPVTRLYTLQIHNEQHLCGYIGSSATVSKVRLKVWVVRIEHMVNKV